MKNIFVQNCYTCSLFETLINVSAGSGGACVSFCGDDGYTRGASEASSRCGEIRAVGDQEMFPPQPGQETQRLRSECCSSMDFFVNK